jgi:hypothetical protein
MSQERFDQSIQWMRWLEMGRAHLIAAECVASRRNSDDVCDEQDVMAVFYMLAGYAVENIVKGWLHDDEVRHHNSVEQGRLGKAIKTHDVRSLVLTTGFPAASGDQALLDALTEANQWSGRYPAPLSAQGLRNRPARPPVHDLKDFMRRFVAHIGRVASECPNPFERQVGCILTNWWST